MSVDAMLREFYETTQDIQLRFHLVDEKVYQIAASAKKLIMEKDEKIETIIFCNEIQKAELDKLYKKIEADKKKRTVLLTIISTLPNSDIKKQLQDFVFNGLLQ